MGVCFFCSNFPEKQTGERGKGLYIGVGDKTEDTVIESGAREWVCAWIVTVEV